MKIFNSYTNQLEEFVPIHEGKVNMYVCGPTVYNYIHIGNARPVIFFDTVRRYFEYLGYEVKYVSNFTDVDDKIINKAIETKQTEKEVTDFYIDAFLTDVAKLNSKTDYIKPRVTEYMDHIISYIDHMINKGVAYKVDGDVYFRVDQVDNYGHLSNQKIDDLISGSRIDVNNKKENPLDFTLWKETNAGITFDAPFGEGRPGWHTECVAMIDDIFEEKIDIHGGGSGLMFPHHENEIAQSLALNHHRLANVWMHNGLLNIGGGKMSKSEGNFILVKDLDIDSNVFRLFTLSTHYRSPINYTDDALQNYQAEWDKIERAYKQLFVKIDLMDALDQDVVLTDQFKQFESDFKAAMDQDFNTSNGITVLQDVVKATNQLIRGKKDVSDLLSAKYVLETIFNVFGLVSNVKAMSFDDKTLYKAWQQARKDKDFDQADRLRDDLIAKGIL